MYSLVDLLGEELADELITRSKYVEEKSVIMKRARHTVPAQILLAQLQGYLAQSGP